MAQTLKQGTVEVLKQWADILSRIRAASPAERARIKKTAGFQRAVAAFMNLKRTLDAKIAKQKAANLVN
jgi:hypothetical protein